MFGYVKIRREELRLKELDLYSGWYCGLCRVLYKDYGITSGFLLNYDCTFLAITLALAYGEKYSTEKMRCPFKPICGKRLTVTRNPALEFAAAMNVLLAFYSLEDGYIDDKNIAKGAGMLIYSSAAKKAAEKYPKVSDAIKTALSELHQLEKDNISDIDLSSNASSKLLSHTVASYNPEHPNSAIASSLCGSIGRWIYIADAWCDRKKDKKHGNYNPFCLSETDDEKDKAMHLLYITLMEAKEAFDLIEPLKPTMLSEIISNALKLGCVDVTEAVLNDKYKLSIKRRNNN